MLKKWRERFAGYWKRFKDRRAARRTRKRASKPSGPGKRATRFKAAWNLARKRARLSAKRVWDQRRRFYRKSYRRNERKAKKRKKPPSSVLFSIGPPHWGGSDDVLELYVEPVAAAHGLYPNSAKRSACYGNCGSDHHVSQSTASARDFPTANNYALAREIEANLKKKAEAVYGSWSGDYDSFKVKFAGRWYRVQIIAGTHGTGPHLHVGIRLS